MLKIIFEQGTDTIARTVSAAVELARTIRRDYSTPPPMTVRVHGHDYVIPEQGAAYDVGRRV